MNLSRVPLPVECCLTKTVTFELGLQSRYVGVVQFVFHVLQRPPIIVTQQKICCISKSMFEHQHSSNFS
jgi:hypothetical protein